nr:MAG: hypothetical protein [uncultured archaeon]
MAEKTTKVVGLPYLPKKYSIVERGGKAYVTTKGHRRYKTPAKVRRRISAGLRRMKLPLLTIAAGGVPLYLAGTTAGGLTKVFTQRGSFVFGRELLSYYTGIYIESANVIKFIPQRMMVGLLPLVGLMMIKRFGVFRGVNRSLGRMRIPLRLS